MTCQEVYGIKVKFTARAELTGPSWSRQENEYIDPCFGHASSPKITMGNHRNFSCAKAHQTPQFLTYGISGMVIYPWELEHHLYINPYGKGLLTIPKHGYII